MEKFFVIVNFKYLVMVEAATHGGAEHKILDNVYYGIETCQAFSMAEISTDFFKCRAKECETISYAELQRKAEEYKRISDELDEEKENAERYVENIRIHEVELEAEKNNLRDSQLNIEALKNRINSIW